jgi:replicative DNA helicase
MKKLMTHGIERLAKAPIFIDDTPALNIFELRAKARRLVHNHGVGVIIIDYLQLMSGHADGKGSNREQEISKISRDLKGLAKELQVPIIALSQLSRDVEKRKDGNKMPQLSDLRESGAIEQDADMVMFLYRPEYYEINTNEMGESNKGETHVRIAKHRNGQLDTIKLRAILEFQRFEDDGSLENPGGGSSNSFAGLRSSDGGANNEAKLYIQKGSKMNDMDFDDGSEEAPF